MNPQQNKNSFEYRREEEVQPQELNDEELASQQLYHDQLNESLYGKREAFDRVEAGRYREQYRDVENAASLEVAEAVASGDYSENAVKQALVEAEMYANTSANAVGIGHDQIHFGDVDARMSAELERAASNNAIGEHGTLNDHDTRKVQESLAMESELATYLEGRNPTLFETVDDSLAYAIKANIAQLVNKYGDVTKASNEELQSIYNMLESGQNTNVTDGVSDVEQKLDPLADIAPETQDDLELVQ